MKPDPKRFSTDESGFSLGVVSTIAPSRLEPGMVQALVNGYPSKSGDAVKRTGYELASALDPADAVRAIRRYVSEDGELSYLLVWAGPRLLRIDDDGTTTVLKADLDTSGPIAHEEWGGIVYFSDGVTGLWGYGPPGGPVRARTVQTVDYTINTETRIARPPVYERRRATIVGRAKTSGVAGNAITLQISEQSEAGEPLMVSSNLAAQAIFAKLGIDNGARASVALPVGGGTASLLVSALEGGSGWNVWTAEIVVGTTAGVTEKVSIGFDSSAHKLTINCEHKDGARPKLSAVAAAINSHASAKFYLAADWSGDGDTLVAASVASTPFVGGDDLSQVATTPAELVGALNTDEDISSLATFAVVSDVGIEVADPQIPPVYADLWAFSGGAAGTDDPVLQSFSPLSFRFLAKRQASERLFGVEAADPTNVRWSEPFDAAEWAGDSVYSPGGEFTALVEVDKLMVCATADRIYAINGSDPATWQPLPVGSDGLGCIAPDTLRVVEGVAVYLSARGMAFYDGTKPKPLSDAVYDSKNPATALIPDDPARCEGAFVLVEGDTLLLFFKSEAAAPGCDRAMYYDLRMQAWGGPYTLGFHATCATLREGVAEPACLPTLGTAAGQVVRSTPDGYTDLGEPYQFLLRTRAIDSARPSLDKIFREVRVLLTCGDEADVDVRWLCEQEPVPRAKASRTYTLPAGEERIRKALQNLRARSGYIEVASAAATSVRVAAAAVDLFFPGTP